MTLPAIKDDVSHFIPENAIDLKKFPLNVRKVAKKMLESDKPMPLSQACREAGVNYDSFRVQLTKCRQKGLDFQAFIDEQSSTILKLDKMAVNRSLLDGAVSGSHNHQKLYYQLTGDLKENNTVNIGTLTVGVVIQQPSQDTQRDKGVIDVEPMIPKGK